MILTICLLVGIFIYYCVILHFVKNGSIYLKYALLWFGLGLFFLVFTLFPSLLSGVMSFIGISNPLNGLFAFLFFFLFIFIICLLTTITRLNSSNRRLVQKVGILENNIKTLEEKMQEIALREKDDKK